MFVLSPFDSVPNKIDPETYTAGEVTSNLQSFVRQEYPLSESEVEEDPGVRTLEREEPSHKSIVKR